MEMTLRWYGSKFDTVTLEQIRQIPGVTGVITTLYDTAPGDVWSRERIQEMKAEVAAAGLQALMQMLIALIGVCAAAMLLWYVYILMKGDDQA